MAKFLDVREQPQLEIAMPGGKTVVLTRKHIPASRVGEHDKRVDELNKQQIAGEIEMKEYCYSMLAHLASDFRGEDFDDLDIYSLRDTVSAMNQINLEGRRATEKKSG